MEFRVSMDTFSIKKKNLLLIPKVVWWVQVRVTGEATIRYCIAKFRIADINIDFLEEEKTNSNDHNIALFERL